MSCWAGVSAIFMTLRYGLYIETRSEEILLYSG